MKYVYCTLVMLLSSVDPVETAGSRIKVLGTGASMPASVLEKWIFLYTSYRSNTHGVTPEFNYKAVNSGTGRCNIMRKCLSKRRIVFAGNDSPLEPEEWEQYPELEMFPILAAPLTIAYNIPGYQLNLTREVFVDILSAKIQHWDDAAILKHNPRLKWTQLGPIKFIGRLGTTASTRIITTFASKVSSNWRNQFGIFSNPSIDPNSGKSRKWPAELNIRYAETAATMMSLVSKEKFTISYMGHGDSFNSGVQVASIRNSKRDWIHPEQINKGVTAALAAATFSEHLEANPVDVGVKGAYPLVTYTYHLVNKTTHDDIACESAAEYFRFIERALTDEEMRAEVETYGLVPLPTNVRDTVIKRIHHRMSCRGKSIRSIIQATIDAERQRKFLETFNKFIIFATVFGILLLLGILAFVYHRTSKRRKVRNTFFLDPLAFEMDDKPQKETGIIFDHRGGKYKKQSVSCSALFYKGLCNRKFEYKTLRKGCHYIKDIQHDNLQTILGFTMVQGRPFVVSEKVRGDRNLRTILETTGTYLDCDVRTALLQQVAEGLEYLHSKDIVHGFLCPSTCLVDGNYAVKLSDWIHISILRCLDVELSAIKQIGDKLRQLEGTNIDPIDMDLLHFIDMDVFRHKAFVRAHDVYSFSLIAVVMYSKKSIDALLSDRFEECLPAVELLKDNLDHEFPKTLKSVCEAVVDGFPSNRPSMSKINKMMFKAGVFRHGAIVDILIERLEDHVLRLQLKVRK